MRGLFFYTIVIGLVLGIGVGTVFAMSLFSVFWLLLVAGCLVLVMGRKSGAFSPHYFVLPLLLIFIALGLLRTTFISSGLVPSLDSVVGTEVKISGVVVREPDKRINSTHLFVQTGDTLLLVYADRNATVHYGDLVTATGTLKQPESFTTDLGREFNYPQYLKARGVSYTMSFAEVDVIDSGQGNSIVSFLLTLKENGIERIESVIPEPAVGLGKGLLLGVQGALGSEYETVFRRAGIMHIVVLSGYNIMLVVTFFMYLMAYLLPYRLRLLVGIVGVIGFALMVGLSATVVRASIMASLILLVKFHGMTHQVLRALMLAGVIMLLINPFLLLYDIGFQLSFLATLSLILVAPLVEKYFARVPSWLGMREFLVATITTQLCVTPLLLYQIGEVSVIAVLVNVLVLPMVPLAMLLTFLTGLLTLVSYQASALIGYGAYLSLEYILEIARFFASFPVATISIKIFPIWLLILSYLFLIGIVLWLTSLQKAVIKTKKVSKLKKPVDISNWVIEEEVKVAGELSLPATKA